MNISIVSVGKIKEKYFKDAISEYEKRLKPYVKLKIIEVNDEKAPENLSEKELEIVKDREADRILKKIKENSYIISLEIEGKSLSSESFSKLIKEQMTYGMGCDLVFVIGGSNGLSKKISQKADYKLSFSQIYRAYKIINNEPYHK